MVISHPLLAEITQLAQGLAEPLGLEVVQVTYKTHTQPATLRVDLRHPERPTGIDDCASFSRILEPALDEITALTAPYQLEVSSPGIDRVLTTEREFLVFRGFPVEVTGYGPIDGQKVWSGTLLKYDETHLYLNLQGRVVRLPRDQVARVQLCPTQP